MHKVGGPGCLRRWRRALVGLSAAVLVAACGASTTVGTTPKGAGQETAVESCATDGLPEPTSDGVPGFSTGLHRPGVPWVRYVSDGPFDRTPTAASGYCLDVSHVEERAQKLAAALGLEPPRPRSGGLEAGAKGELTVMWRGQWTYRRASSTPSAAPSESVATKSAVGLLSNAGFDVGSVRISTSVVEGGRAVSVVPTVRSASGATILLEPLATTVTVAAAGDVVEAGGDLAERGAELNYPPTSAPEVLARINRPLDALAGGDAKRNEVKVTPHPRLFLLRVQTKNSGDILAAALSFCPEDVRCDWWALARTTTRSS